MVDTLKSAIILSVVDMTVVFAVLILLLGIIKILKIFTKEKVVLEDQVPETSVIDSPKAPPSDYDEASTLEKYITVQYEDGSVKEIHFKEVE